MKGEIIGTSVFEIHDGTFVCMCGLDPHGKAVIMERRTDINSIGYFCAFHAREYREEARDRRDRARARRP